MIERRRTGQGGAIRPGHTDLTNPLSSDRSSGQKMPVETQVSVLRVGMTGP